MDEDTTSMESLAQLLRRAINMGAPLYNQGHPDKCFQVYSEAAQMGLQQPMLAESKHGQLLQDAVNEVSTESDPTQGAWVLRRCFDQILTSANELFVGNSVVSTDSEWQDGAATNKTVEEKAQALQDITYILSSGVVVANHEESSVDAFPASAAVELLTQLGLAKTRNQASEKCNLLQKAGLILPVTDTAIEPFHDGTTA